MRMNKGAVQPLLPATMATDAPAQRHCASRGPRHHLVSGDDPPTSLAPPDTSRPCPAEEAIMKQDAFVARTKIVCGSRDYRGSPSSGRRWRMPIRILINVVIWILINVVMCPGTTAGMQQLQYSWWSQEHARTRKFDPGFCAHVQHLMGFTLSVLLAERLRGREIDAHPRITILHIPGGNGRLESRERHAPETVIDGAGKCGSRRLSGYVRPESAMRAYHCPHADFRDFQVRVAESHSVHLVHRSRAPGAHRGRVALMAPPPHRHHERHWGPHESACRRSPDSQVLRANHWATADRH